MDAPPCSPADLAVDLRTVKSRLESLQVEVAAMRQALASLGALPAARLQAEVHRLHFAATLRAHPCCLNKGFADILQIDGFAGMLARASNRCSAGQVLCVSKTLRGLLRALDPLSGSSVAVPLFGRLCMWQPVQGTVMSLGGAIIAQDSDDSFLGDYSAAQLERSVYVCGGGGYSFGRARDVKRFGDGCASWVEMPPMTEARWFHTVTALGGRLYVCGGNDGTCSAERLDPHEQVWQPLPPMLVGRSGHAAAAARGRLYVAGGELCGGSAEAFDPAAGAWEPVPSSGLQHEPCSAAAQGDAVYVFGRRTWTLTRLDTAGGRWTPLPPPAPPVKLAAKSTAATAAATPQAFFVLFCRSVHAALVMRLDFSSGTWSHHAPALSIARLPEDSDTADEDSN